MDRYTWGCLFLIVALSIESVFLLDGCPPGGIVYHGHNYQVCYFVLQGNATLSYSERVKACEVSSGHISYAPDVHANAFLLSALSDLLGDTKLEIAVGLNDIDVENEFRKWNGDVQAWINWWDGQPDDWHGEDCTAMFMAETDLMVNDRRCHDYRDDGLKVDHAPYTLCHVAFTPDLPSYRNEEGSDRRTRTSSKLQFPAKGIVGAELVNTVVFSPSMCAFVCHQTSACYYFKFSSSDSSCVTFAIPKLQVSRAGPVTAPREEDELWVLR